MIFGIHCTYFCFKLGLRSLSKEEKKTNKRMVDGIAPVSSMWSGLRAPLAYQRKSIHLTLTLLPFVGQRRGVSIQIVNFVS